MSSRHGCRKTQTEGNNPLKTEILYEDKHLLVINKPAGLATQSARMSEPDVVSELKNYLAGKNPTKAPYLGVIHRLDQPVEGILVFAKTKQAAAGLSGQFLKQYLALVEGIPAESSGKLINYLEKEGNLAKITEEGKGQKAVLTYKTLETCEQGYSLVEVTLETGRFHQIRVQFAGMGHSILGDRKYGSEKALALGGDLGLRTIALCAYKCTFTHPFTGKAMEFHITPTFLQVSFLKRKQ